MTALTSFLNRESTKAVREVFQLVGIPALTIIGGVFINQANKILVNQEKFLTEQQEQGRQIKTNTKDINKLVRADQLFDIQQESAYEALKFNSVIGLEFDTDYDKKFKSLVGKNNFLMLSP